MIRHPRFQGSPEPGGAALSADYFPPSPQQSTEKRDIVSTFSGGHVNPCRPVFRRKSTLNTFKCDLLLGV